MEEYRDILTNNKGFDSIDAWLSYAKTHGFKRVSSTRISTCPDCDASIGAAVGSFIYYSTLHTVISCPRCQLWYSNIIIERETRQVHFESAYKSETYFVEDRRDIFENVIERICRSFPDGGRVLEIGGATGVLLEQLRLRSSAFQLTLNDVSVAACRGGQARGLPVIVGSLPEIQTSSQFDVVIALDVLYYQESMPKYWEHLADLVAPGGMLILRGPNVHPIVRICGKLQKLGGILFGILPSNLPLFNPEHLFSFTKNYLNKKLNHHGFFEVRHLCSPLLNRKIFGFSSTSLFSLLLFFEKFIGLVLSPSMLTVARKDRR